MSGRNARVEIKNNKAKTMGYSPCVPFMRLYYIKSNNYSKCCTHPFEPVFSKFLDIVLKKISSVLTA